MNVDFFDITGIIGVALSIYCYARVQWQRDYAKRLRYSLLNLLSAVLLAVSLLHKWNLASFIGNGCWLLISLYGVYRCCKYIWRDYRAKKAILSA